MRVAIVTTSWPRFEGDPSGHFVAAEARALTRRGDAVTVFAPNEVPAFGWPGVAARVREDPRRAIGAVSWVMRTRHALAVADVDRVIAHWAIPSAFPIAGPCKRALEIVSHGGDVRLLTRLPRPITARVARRLVAQAERWRFVASHLVDALAARVPRDVARAIERVAVVEPCAIDVAIPLVSSVAEKRARVGAPFVVCVARLVASKRVDAAIAWASENRAPIVIVGDGPERDALERAARSRGARATFVGLATREEALAWIAAADALVQASRVEGASTVEREARALGTRIVSV